MSLTDTYREATARQMPDLPVEWIDALDGEWSAAPGKAYIHQTGGWTMAIACDNRLLAQDGEFVVCKYEGDEGEDEILIHQGTDAAAAWNVLLNG